MDTHFTYEEDMAEKTDPVFGSGQIKLIIGLLVIGAATVIFVILGLKVPAIICFTVHAIGWIFVYREDIESIYMDHRFEIIEQKQELSEQSLNNRKMEAEMNFREEGNRENERRIKELEDQVTVRDAEISELMEEVEKLKASSAADREAARRADKTALATLLPRAEADNDIVPVDIIAVARTAVEELKESTAEAGIVVDLSTACTKLLVKADPGRLNILFRNIIDNSVKYMQISGRLVITISTIGDDIFIVLKDNGEGLAEDETGRVFELNFQGSNRKSGNGLGLAQAKAIVEYYGGTIYAKSSVGKGMAVYIQLPATSTGDNQ